MVLNTNIVIAVKSNLNKYNMEKVSIFNIEDISKKLIFFKIKIKDKDIIFNVKCPLCEKVHYYKYTINELINREMMIGGCETLNLPLFFIGDEERVISMVNKYKHINSEVYNMTIK